jgi:transcriptional regulator
MTVRRAWGPGDRHAFGFYAGWPNATNALTAVMIPVDYRQKRAYALVGNQQECAVMSKPTDLVQGTLDLLILKIIALEPMHGWAIAQRISQMSNDVLQVGQGSLYPALHKLEQQAWIEAEWRDSENNRRAKYYTLTRDGRRALKQEAAQWERLSAAISLIVRHG